MWTQTHRRTSSSLSVVGRRYHLPFLLFYILLLVVWSSTTTAVVAQAQKNNENDDDNDDNDNDIVFSDCDVNDYYYQDFDTQDIVNSSWWTRSALQAHLEATHRRHLPYTDNDDGDDDVWKALQDIDAGEPLLDNNGAATPTTVTLIYSQQVIPAEPKGTPDTWNREHVWPKSRGVQDSGMDFSDVHHLFPADWTVNSLRNNRFFDECSSKHDNNNNNNITTTTTTTTTCTRLPDDLLAGPDVDTYVAHDFFQPPHMVRGDVARALLYMNIRYPHLQLTDCPHDNNNNNNEDSDNNNEDNNKMAYLSTLLEWHALDPPSSEEIRRNDRICSRWQGNRNPFVDFPQLAQHLYGHPRPRPFQCHNHNNNNNDTATAEPPTSAPSTGTPDDEYYSFTADLQPGDVMIVAVQSDDPDQVALVALVNISAGVEIHLTDRAWNGQAFTNNNEGTVTLQLPRPVSAGTVFGYYYYGGGDSDTEWNSKSDAGFALATAGDTIIVSYSSPFAKDEEGDDDNGGEKGDDDDNGNSMKFFLSALSYDGPWQQQDDVGQMMDSSMSALPASIQNFAVALPHFDNYAYIGPMKGSKRSLQQALTDPANWEGTNNNDLLDSSSAPPLAVFSLAASSSSQVFEITDAAAAAADDDDDDAAAAFQQLYLGWTWTTKTSWWVTVVAILFVDILPI
jgi:endonuclease I